MRLHRNTPPELYERIVEMIAPHRRAFLLNFDERSMAGMMVEAKKAGVENLIHAGNVHDYAPSAAWRTQCRVTTAPVRWMQT